MILVAQRRKEAVGSNKHQPMRDYLMMAISNQTLVKQLMNTTFVFLVGVPSKFMMGEAGEAALNLVISSVKETPSKLPLRMNVSYISYVAAKY